MHIGQVEIYSDATNAAVMRHPARHFPGVLVQGDTLYSLCRQADSICTYARSRLDEERFDELNGLRNDLWGFLSHYKAVMGEHGIPLPYSED
jgi:hypothetical protein